MRELTTQISREGWVQFKKQQLRTGQHTPRNLPRVNAFAAWEVPLEATFHKRLEAATEGSGEVRVHGHARVGDAITILCWGFLHDGQTLAHRAKVVTVNGNNKVVSLLEG